MCLALVRNRRGVRRAESDPYCSWSGLLWGTRMRDVTSLLTAIQQDDPQAAAELLPLVYQKLRQLAARNWPLKGPAILFSPRHWSTKPI